MPPSPITGIFTACAAWYTKRNAIGLMAGPESPPKPAPRRGRRVRASMASATKVFTSEMASAPLCSAARASGSMAATLGDNFTISGRRATRFTAPTTSASSAGSLEK